MSLNFLLAAKVDEPVARILNFGNPSAPIFNRRAGSRNWWISSNTTTGFAAGWTAGIQAALDTQVAASTRADYTKTTGNASWYRDIPVLVRLDVTTRTATQRAEYSAANNVLAYKNLTQSLVLVPRHFGLTLK